MEATRTISDRLNILEEGYHNLVEDFNVYNKHFNKEINALTKLYRENRDETKRAIKHIHLLLNLALANVILLGIALIISALS